MSCMITLVFVIEDSLQPQRGCKVEEKVKEPLVDAISLNRRSKFIGLELIKA